MKNEPVFPSFSGLDAAELDALARITTIQSYEAGEVIFLEREPCRGLYIVEEGWLKAVKTSLSGREQVIRFLGPGEECNEVGVFTDGVNQATLIALEPVQIRIVQREALINLLNEHPALAKVIIQNMAGRIMHLMDLIEDLSLRTVVARLARMFLDHSDGEILSRRRWSTQTEMAARLGTVPDVLNRALRSLADESLIEIERHQVRILDRAGLESKAAGDQ
jgi:CRP-like cAMP-binding protein